MSDHTAEPWRVRSLRRQWLIESSGYVVAELMQFGNEDARESNARRIVACVNACAGIPAEELEQFVAAGGALHFDANLGRLRKQVADLRAALEAVSNEADEWDDHDGRLAHVAYPTILDVRRVLAAAEPQEVQG